MTAVEEIATLTEPHHPDDWTDMRAAVRLT